MDGWCGQLYHNDFSSLANQGPFVERAGVCDTEVADRSDSFFVARF